jgi:hypothetical protein
MTVISGSDSSVCSSAASSSVVSGFSIISARRPAYYNYQFIFVLRNYSENSSNT